MVKLQRPAFVFMNGELVPWDDARIHVGAPALTRGISVLEGIKGYWQHDESHLALLALRPHFERLQRSALLQHLPFAWCQQLQSSFDLITIGLVATGVGVLP